MQSQYRARSVKTKKGRQTSEHQRVYISRTWGEETPGPIASKFCFVIGTQDITCIKFGDDRFSGLWLAGCQSSPFSVDFDIDIDIERAL